jgi:hypothetical protein
LNYSAIRDARVNRDHQDEGQKSDNSGQVRLCVPGICPEQDGQTAAHKGKPNDRDQKGFWRDHHLWPGRDSSDFSLHLWGIGEREGKRIRASDEPLTSRV